MGGLNRGRYTVIIDGPWRLYSSSIPKGWTIIGTIKRDWQAGALALSPVGLYAQINVGNIISQLDQRKTLHAIDAARRSAQ